MSRMVLTLACAALSLIATLSAAAEWNPLRRAPVSLGAESHRIIVGFRTTPANGGAQTVTARAGRRAARVIEAQTSAADVAMLAGRTGLAVARSRQVAPSMHVLMLPQTLSGARLESVLAALRRDPAVSYAEVDQRRFPHAVVTPDDPLFTAAIGVSGGQWYLMAPNPSIVVEGVATQDLAATDAQDAWALTTGSGGIVIADVDTGVLFDHPDLLRADLGGRLLPGYDFVGEDFSPTTGVALGTYLIANDGDGWDPDPSDPGDWITSTDVKNSLFPTKDCGDPSQYPGGIIPSSWHGTRVVGVFGAITDNAAGIAGLTWANAQLPGPWILPVRALGKCGGYDSDIIAGIRWAAGLAPTTGSLSDPPVPPNPFPADIINLSLGGSGTCSPQYQQALQQVTQLGVLVVVSAGNGGTPGALAPVDAPANCSKVVPGVIAVAGLRNVGTKVGYSSFGPEVGISAPAGNCLNQNGNCLRSIDTTTNDGNQAPDAAGMAYTNELTPNLGTSFSAPMVSGVAALMRSVNANLTPAQLVARLEASAAPFPPNSLGLPVCPVTTTASGECACPAPGPGVMTQCGTGMVNALNAVHAALQPIAVIPAPAAAGTTLVFDAGASVASCGNSIARYAWSANPAALIQGTATGAQVTVLPAAIAAGGTGTLALTLTDSAGNVATETVTLGRSGVLGTTASTAPVGSAATACPPALATNPATPVAPTVAAAWAPASVGTGTPSTLMLTLRNANGFALTHAGISVRLPAGLALASSGQATTTCSGPSGSLLSSAAGIALSDSIVPAGGSCTLAIPVQAAGAGSYALTIPAGALTTAPAGVNAAATTATLTVTPPSGGGGGGGGGQLGWAELLLGACAWLASRRRAVRA